MQKQFKKRQQSLLSIIIYYLTTTKEDRKWDREKKVASSYFNYILQENENSYLTAKHK